jgi:hydroxymethylbilane synthase
MKVIRIGTRSSDLALWQATTVADQLKILGHTTEIVKIDSIGDEVLDKPLYELGITGVFTKNLDIALLNEKIDIAVHSLKDVPTLLPKGVVQAAVLKRGNFNDVLLLKDNERFFEKETAVIATGSLRRKAQWLSRYPNHQVTDLRGNVPTRLRKLKENDWDGAVFASAGLKRLNLLPKKDKFINLNWMVPAPGQGAVMIVTLEKNKDLIEICKEINDPETAICVQIERDFLKTLEGGCTAPIGALATINDDQVRFKGVLHSPDGSAKLEFESTTTLDDADELGKIAAQDILDRGGKKLMYQGMTLEKKHRVFSTKTLSNDQISSFSDDIGVAMSDFISIRFNRLKPSSIKEPIEHVVITSKNAVESLLHHFSPDQLKFKNIYCVGKRTKRLIENRIQGVTHSEQSAEKLAYYLKENLKDPKEVTFFCGNKRRDELVSILENNAIPVNEIECYKTILTPNQVEDTISSIMFYSPTGIQSYLLENDPGDQVAFCIGETTASEARKYFKTVIVSRSAAVSGVIDAVNTHYKK